MIDREARNRLAESLRQLGSGRISNDEFEGRRSDSSPDRAIDAIYDQAWFLYSDLREHTLTGLDRLSPDVRHAVVRWIVFLYSDLEYQWPECPLYGLRGALFKMVTRGRSGRAAAATWGSAGDVGVWPFIDQSHLAVARSKPRLLAAAMPN